MKRASEERREDTLSPQLCLFHTADLNWILDPHWHTSGDVFANSLRKCESGLAIV